MPKVSVIIPVFNVESYLEECLESVVSQTFRDIEIICIDDASTDNSFNILKEYAQKDSRIKILKNEQNRGQSFSRNRGMDVASGDYIAFVDSDDYIEKDLIKTVVGKADNVDMVCFDYKKKDEIWNSRDGHLFEMHIGEYPAQDFFASEVNHNSIIYSPWSKFYRRKFLTDNSIRFVEGIQYEDIVFHLLCMINADNVYCITDKLYVYRVRSNSTMTQNTEGRNVTDYFWIICYIVQIYFEHDFDRELEKVMEKYIHTVYRSFTAKYRRYALVNDAYLLKNDIQEEKYAKAYGIVSGYGNYCGTVQECIIRHMELIRGAGHIIVYGAGDIAGEVLETLDRYDIAIDAVAVSDKTDNRNSLFGNRVYEIAEYMGDKRDTLVIMAVSVRFYAEIRRTLSELGFSRWLELF